MELTPVWKVTVREETGSREFLRCWIQIDPTVQTVHIWSTAGQNQPTLSAPLASTTIEWSDPEITPPAVV